MRADLMWQVPRWNDVSAGRADVTSAPWNDYDAGGSDVKSASLCSICAGRLCRLCPGAELHHGKLCSHTHNAQQQSSELAMP